MTESSVCYVSVKIPKTIDSIRDSVRDDSVSNVPRFLILVDLNWLVINTEPTFWNTEFLYARSTY